MSIKSTAMKAGLASALLLSAVSLAAAQSDPLAHTKTPGFNGQCWKVTDARGFGYWNTCQPGPRAAAPLRGATSFAAAENATNDPLVHTKTPGFNGQCWKVTDARGFGYWTTCQ